MTRKASDDWTATLTHPDTGRTLRPDILDDPVIIPSLNGLPEIRLPVRRDGAWLDFPDGATLDVWLDGLHQPIDELSDTSDDKTGGLSVLEGIGGTELRERVEVEYDNERRHIAAEDLINNHTSYTADVDAPDSETLLDEVVQAADTTAEFQDVFSEYVTDSSIPLEATNDTLQPQQIAYFAEGESEGINAPSDGSNAKPDEWSDGAAAWFESTGRSATYTFELDHDIPDGNVGVALRVDDGGGGTTETAVSLDGTEIDRYELGFGSILDWDDSAQDPLFGSGYSGGLSAGTHTVEIECFDGGAGDQVLYVDCVVLYDTRYTDALNWDNTVNTTGGYLDDPPLYPTSFNAESDAYNSAFSILAGAADVTMDDTTGQQRLQASNDGGATYLPDDGTENNTTSIDVDFADAGATLRSRIRFDAWEPSGPRSQTPRLNYEPQTVSTYELRADIQQESLLIDERYDDTLESILNDIAGEQYIWSYRLVDGTPTVTWTQPGQRTSDTNPDIGEVSISKNLDTYRLVTIKGSNQIQSSEPFTASTTFQNLVHNGLLKGSEAVYDPDTGENFARGEDYELDRSAGEIRATDNSNLTLGDTYRIDYRYGVEGTHQPSGADPGRPPFIEQLPGVTSSRQAEQIAYVFAEVDPGLASPSYQASLSIPRSDATFNVIDAFSLTNLDLPADATPLAIRGTPEVTPQGIDAQLGGQRRLEAALEGVREQLSRVTERS